MASDRKKKIKYITGLMLILYFAVLIYVCFFSERYGRNIVSDYYRYNLEPFKEIHRFFAYKDILGAKAFIINMFGNVLAFAQWFYDCGNIGKMQTLLFDWCPDIGSESDD